METGYEPFHGDIWVEKNGFLAQEGGSCIWEFDLYQWIYRRATAPNDNTGLGDQGYQKIHENGKNSYWRKRIDRHQLASMLNMPATNTGL